VARRAGWWKSPQPKRGPDQRRNRMPRSRWFATAHLLLQQAADSRRVERRRSAWVRRDGRRGCAGSCLPGRRKWLVDYKTEEEDPAATERFRRQVGSTCRPYLRRPERQCGEWCCLCRQLELRPGSMVASPPYAHNSTT
jgi:hypothetical protein